MSGALLTGRDILSDRVRDCDVCVIGSGAGGAVLAAGLAARGLDVVVLEEGGAYTRPDFDMQEAKAYRNLYQDQGGRTTADRAITVLQGRSLGGGTTVNWTTCYRTPDRILRHWADVHGAEGLESADLAPHFDAVEARLNITPWPEALVNENNRAILTGARALGWQASTTSRNVKGCANSGYCSMGCPVDGKQAMHLTYLADARASGAEILVDVRAERLVMMQARIIEVRALVLDRQTRQPMGTRVTIRPRAVALCGGAINSPALLIKSDLNLNGHVGRRTFLHPVVAVLGLYDQPVRGFYGAPQSVASHQHIDRGAGRLGFFLESAPVHPMLASLAGLSWGAAQRELMGSLAHRGVMIALSVDGLLPEDPGGQVVVKADGRVALNYPVRPALEESFRAAHQALVRLTLAAGAREALLTHIDEDVIIRSEADLSRLDGLRYGAHRHAIFSAHQMGGCAIGRDARTSVVNSALRHHEIGNLFVVDGSVFPTALGVNPSETIYGLAHRAVDAVAETV